MTAGAVTALSALMLSLLPAAAAQAATVYELDGRWGDGTPATVGRGDVVNAEWLVNVNDDPAAPANDPVDNVTFTATLERGLFTEVPDVCLTTGVTPASAISADGRTLTCNLGTVVQGTAIMVLTPVTVDGVTGEQVTAAAELNGQQKALDPIDIVNDFAMDMQFGGNTTYYNWNPTYTGVDVDLQWALRLGRGSDPGPDSVTYRLQLSDNNGGTVTIGTSNQGLTTGCTPFNSSRASGVPWSELPNYPADQQTSFVDSCTLTPVAGQPGSFDLTLSGINYDLATVPTKDSTVAADPLPTDWSYIASGSLWLHVATAQAGSITLQSNAPTYTSTTGLTSTDLTANNSTDKTYVLPGGWAAAWYRPYTGSGGNNWDDTYRVSAGTTVMQYLNNNSGRANVAPTALHGQCLVFDSDYVDYAPRPAGAVAMILGYDGTTGSGELDNPPTLQYYVGNAVGNPNTFNCGTDAANWVNTEPADLTTVKAVRIIYPHSLIAAEGWEGFQLRAYPKIEDDVPVGQDVWMFGSVLNPATGVWEGPGEPWNSADIKQTPGARYPFTNGRRDILRIISATPSIQKSSDRSIVKPGEPATFTLTYSANGAGAIPDTVDDYTIVDTLPLGVTYVAGSASPAPQVTTNASGQQVLTWSLDGVTTNVRHPLTYQAVAGDTVAPGQVLTNTATSSVGGQTTVPASAQVTVSTSGYTILGKTTDQWFIANPDGSGDGEGSWTVSLRSADPLPQAFTDTIDILPYNGDGRGTDYVGTYEVTSVEAPAGATVYYTDADPATLSDDPSATANGTAGTPSAMWATTKPANPTAIRVVGGELAPGATSAFKVNIATDGAEPGDVWMNRAQARAEHTELVMRTSEPLTMGTMYSVSLKKYVQDANGEWRDANDVADYPSFRPGDTIKYRVVVENTGQGTVTNLTVSDDKQPELGAFVVEELAPGETESHEYEIVADETLPQTLVNTACAAADQPADSEDPVDVNCDPAGIELVGDPTHEKELISATPIGGGQWEVVYGIDVTNESVYPTLYDLDDTLHFAKEAKIASATVTVSPDGVTLADPAWNGQGDVLIASQVPLVGTDDEGYAPHHYEVTVIADVPLVFDGAGSGEGDPTRCGPEGDDADRAFNNTSAMTDPTGAVEDDQACAEIPSIEIDKTVASGPREGADGRWTVVYDIVATNKGGAAGEYDLYDKLLFGKGIEIVSAKVISAPSGVTAETGWTGLGADKQSAQNLVAADVMLDSDTSHTYTMEIAVSAGTDELTLDVLRCAPTGSGQPGGLANSATLDHNGLTAQDDVCPTLPIRGLAVTGGDIAWWTLATALVLMLAGGGALMIRRRRDREADDLAEVEIV